MTRLIKAVTLGILIGVFGLIALIVPFGFDLEENVGLEGLFKVRGTRQAPPDVLIVSMDKVSADKLNLPVDPRKWPRSLHGQLIDNLVREGAVVIAFDLTFEEPHSAEEDKVFAEAVQRARNVVLCEYLKSERITVDEKGGAQRGAHVVKLVPPIPELSQYAVARAPFPLPKIPVKVSQYWTFKTDAGDTPTLPVIVLQIFSMNVYDDFIHILENVSPEHSGKLPRDGQALLATRGIEKLVRDIRTIFEKEPLIAGKMLKELQHTKTSSTDEKKYRLISSLTNMYQRPNSQYLNFYGPPRTITTVPYYQLLHLHEHAHVRQQVAIRGKAVFVGHSVLSQSEQKEQFYTVFSQPDGLDISGVEIAATAFANLIEDMTVKTRSGQWLIIIVFWGVLMGIVCRLLPPVITLVSVIGLGILYFIEATLQFKSTATWYPVVIPLLFQMPLAFLGAVVWKYIDSNKERQNIKKALGYYLPEHVVNQLAKNIADLKAGDQIVYGICLSSDAEQYTAFSENMEPGELGRFMDRYYETVFTPIKKHGGFVSDVVGDAVLAVWMSIHPEPILKQRACHAALDIASATHQFQQASGTSQLSTRIGLHSGKILLGSVGAVDHYEYRAVGDIVNTATRVEGLNKYLGTRILVTEEVIGEVSGFLTREMGKFLLVGKSKPLMVYELVCREEEANEAQKKACELFSETIDTFRKQSWDEAIEKFQKYIENFGEDKPTQFYLRICEQYRAHPPDESWDGVVPLDKK